METNKFQDVVVDRTTTTHSLNDGGEVVVSQNHVAGFLGDFGSGDAHCHADISSTKCSGVVYAIASHCNDFAVCSKRLNNAHFVLGRDARTNSNRSNAFCEFFVRHRLEVVTRHDLALDSQLRGDRSGGHCVISRNHLHVDASAMAQRNCITSFGSRRIDDSDKKFQTKVFGPRFGVEYDSLVIKNFRSLQATSCHGEHSHSLGRESVVFGVTETTFRISQFLFIAMRIGIRRRQPEHDIWGAFDAKQDVTLRVVRIDPMKRGHELRGRIERDLAKPWTTSSLFDLAQTSFRSEHDKGSFSGIADNAGTIFRSGHEHGVRTQHCWKECLCRDIVTDDMAAR